MTLLANSFQHIPLSYANFYNDDIRQLLWYGKVAWFFYFHIFWSYCNFDLCSNGHFLSLFLWLYCQRYTKSAVFCGYLAKVQPAETHLLYFCQFGSCVFVSLYFMGVFLSYHIKNISQIGSIWQKYNCSDKNTPRQIDITDKNTSNNW